MIGDEITEANTSGTFDSRLDVIITVIALKRNGYLDMSEIVQSLKTDMWAILSTKEEWGSREEVRKLNSLRMAVGVLEGALMVYLDNRPRSKHETRSNHAAPQVYS